MRILRLCLHEPRTNREFADELGLNPGTMLHHVRTLVDTGLLRADEARRGARGAREVPYLATRVSWNTSVEGISPILIDTFLQEIEGLPADEIRVMRLGLKLTDARRDELIGRVHALFQEYASAEADVDGSPLSLLFAEHPDVPRAERGIPE
ncbi:ArsR/SmtB family transcription factor [Lacisediminihabitans changchengi]|uniref:Winged helix-turn-helix transcriptional regulator n=1 Tax=Lacisediminihabitans changchengi TaxID=2787634 RepID=A0A934SP45_9MICO|nr:winged helix-turn-helix domain-containing protein [Lacisediminihabitans changchengi]MBK4346415.1 winged helix-turn-helix transcriptional regulator [Lacisediminihabitans changchengi]